MNRKILHLDLDSFYPSVEVLDNPDLAGKAVIVGGIGPRGVVASASYQARALGVHSALPTAVARRRCPDGIFLRPRFARYRELSAAIFDIYRGWTHLVEPLSLDEAYLDVTHRPERHCRVAESIRTQVREQTGLTVSAGLAHNKFLAKLASDLDKPDGLTEVEEHAVAEFLAPLGVEKLWGVGPSTAARLHAAGFETVGDLAAVSAARLGELFGKNGERLAQFARGEDQRRVAAPGVPKSISAETTFDHDIHSWAQAAPAVRDFARRIAGGLDKRDLWARTVVLKVRFRDFTTITRSLTREDPVRHEQSLLEAARELARRVGLRRGQSIRLIGLGVSNLGDLEAVSRRQKRPALQLDLFGGE